MGLWTCSSPSSPPFVSSAPLALASSFTTGIPPACTFELLDIEAAEKSTLPSPTAPCPCEDDCADPFVAFVVNVLSVPTVPTVPIVPGLFLAPLSTDPCIGSDEGPKAEREAEGDSVPDLAVASVVIVPTVPIVPPLAPRFI